MRRLLTGYVISFNKRHRRSGQLFQNRFKSIVCQEDLYLKELVRYIHLNPVRAGLVSDLSGLNKYPYCGHSALSGSVERKWQDADSDEVFTKGRQDRKVKARSLLCFWAVRELGMSLTELAREFEMSVAGIGYAVERGETIARENQYRLI